MKTTIDSPANPHRLPRTVTPTHYDLELAPDLDTASFAGSVAIDVTVHEATTSITLNAIELDITAAAITLADGTSHEAKAITLDDDFERAEVTFGDELPPGEARLEITFSGILNDKLRGFYRSTYTDDDGVEHTLATTQFESTNARRAFPCWDEPDLKATFAVALVVADGLLAVSCQSETASTVLDDGRRRVVFAPTPIMSTYLVAFVVGRLEATEARDVGGVPLRIIHTPGNADMTTFALDAGAFALQWLTDYFGIPYPGDKLDMVAIPDFAFGAMENLGCVTYREVLLLVDPDRTTQPEQLRSVDVIAHELAHMWFGDLVTMRWWNGLWLKEAFATFMEMLVTDAFRPDWQRWVDFGVSRTAAFDVDSLQSTRPIEFEVISPDDAEGMYDVLTYEKGAAVVRMLEQFLGPEAFREGASHYLNEHAFGNTETHDLWDALESTSGQPVRRIMDSWIFQGGYPLVRVSQPTATSIRLEQSHFRYRNAPGDQQRWVVPIVLSYGNGPDRHSLTALLDDDVMTVDLPAPADWVVVNTAGSGFYRVAYDEDSGARLLDNFDQLSAVERYGVVDDTWAQVLGGELTIADFLSVVQHCPIDEDVAIVRRIAGALGQIDHLAADADRPALSVWAQHLLRARLDRLGTERKAGDDDRTNELRAALIAALGTVGQDDDMATLARTIDADDNADASLQAAATTILAERGTADDFALFVERFKNATSPQEERRNVEALASFPGAAEIDRLLEMTIAGDIRTQDAPYVLGRALQNREHGPRVWRFIVDNWERLNELFPANSISRMLNGIRALSKEEDAASVASFLADNKVPQGGRTVDQHLERLSINVDFRSRVEAQLAEALG